MTEKNITCGLILIGLTSLSGCTDATEELQEAAKNDSSLRLNVEGDRIVVVTVLSDQALRTALEHRAALTSPIGIRFHKVTPSVAQLKMIREIQPTKLTFLACQLDEVRISEIGRTDSLLWLSMTECPITDDDVAALGHLNQLHTLELCRCRSVTGKGFESWSEHKLRSLNLNGAGITDDGLSGLTANVCFPYLKQLNLDETAITPDGLMTLAVMRQLTPAFPDDITPDMASRFEMMRRYNDVFAKLHGGGSRYVIPQ